jgi:ABC-type lipoprotein release transport system permease subunit
MVRGVLPEEEVKAVGLGARMRGGTFESLQAGKYQIILGSALAQNWPSGRGQGRAHGARRAAPRPRDSSRA